MSLCFVFSGTSEGREVTERLADSGINCLVFVATEYGNSVMAKHEKISVRVGRRNTEEIEKLIKDETPDFIIDATHPHAEVITQNIIKACENAGADEKYIRVNRNIGDNIADNCNMDEYRDTICKVNSIEEAVELLKNPHSEFSTGNVMLTTGVKELKNFDLDGIRERLIVRVIPSIESLEEVYRCKIDTKSIIAMEGPFSVDMNTALIHQYKAGALITKNSGSRGGYLEKIIACKKCGIKAIVIDKNKTEYEGKTISDTVTFVKSKLNIVEKKKIYIIGAGTCDEEYLTMKASKLIRNADAIIGAKRMAEFGKKINPDAEIYTEYDSKKIVDIIDKNDNRKIAVLFSGDIGLCSGAKGLLEITEGRDDLNIDVIPGISSISYFASKIGIQYSDYTFISLHGAHMDYMSTVENDGGFFAICSGLNDVIDVSGKVLASEYDKQIICGYNLSAEDEKIIRINNMDDLSDLSEGLYVIAVI